MFIPIFKLEHFQFRSFLCKASWKSSKRFTLELITAMWLITRHPTTHVADFSLLLLWQVDGQRNRTGSSPGPLVGLNVFNQLFVGGYSEFTPELLPLGSRFRQGFQGETPVETPTSFKGLLCQF